MAENKTKPNDASVEAFLNQLDHDQKRADAFTLLKMMEEITGEKPIMWGPSIIGFGDYHYRYESGREGDMFLIGFSPRKQNMTVYFMDGFKRYEELMEKLGKYKTGKSCLYIKKLADVDITVLKEMMQLSVAHVKTRKFS